MSATIQTQSAPTMSTPRRPAPSGVSFGRLIGYEFQRTGRILLVPLLAGILFCILGLGVQSVRAMQDFGMFMVVISGLILTFGVTAVLVFDYWRSAHSQLGYLTHSLPVKGSKQYFARLIYGSVASLLSGILAALLIMLPANWITSGRLIEPELKLLFETLAHNFSSWWWILLFLLLSPMFNQALFYFSATIGSEKAFGRMGIGGPILMYFITNTAMQVITFLSLLIPIGVEFVPGDDPAEFTTKIVKVSNLFDDPSNVLPLMPFIFVPIVSILLIARTAMSWDKRIELR